MKSYKAMLLRTTSALALMIGYVSYKPPKQAGPTGQGPNVVWYDEEK